MLLNIFQRFLFTNQDRNVSYIYMYTHISMYMVISYSVASPVQIICSSPEGKKHFILEPVSFMIYQGSACHGFFHPFCPDAESGLRCCGSGQPGRVWTAALLAYTCRRQTPGSFYQVTPLHAAVVYQLMDLFSSTYFNSPCCFPSRFYDIKKNILNTCV